MKYTYFMKYTYYRKLTTADYETHNKMTELLPFYSGDYLTDLFQVKNSGTLPGTFIRLSKTLYNKEGKRINLNLDQESLKAYFLKNDKPGDFLVVRVGLNKRGQIVSTHFKCDKENCDCMQVWYMGNPHAARKWIFRENVL